MTINFCVPLPFSLSISMPTTLLASARVQQWILSHDRWRVFGSLDATHGLHIHSHRIFIARWRIAIRWLFARMFHMLYNLDWSLRSLCCCCRGNRFASRKWRCSGCSLRVCRIVGSRRLWWRRRRTSTCTLSLSPCHGFKKLRWRVSKLGGTIFDKRVSLHGTAIPLRENKTVLPRSTLPTSCARILVMATTSSCKDKSVKPVVLPFKLVTTIRAGTGLAQVKIAGSGKRRSTAMNGAVGVVLPDVDSLVFFEPPKKEAILDLLGSAVDAEGMLMLN
ncbi:hypothetical protein KCU61_g358, partial [Aureobasidium melanogenum]